MKLRRILAGLWIVLLLLVGTCYAENTENPIVFDNGNEYWRLNLPSVEKTEHLGHYFITALYTRHSMHSIPFVGFYATEDGKGSIVIDPSVDKSLFRKWSEMFYHYQEWDNVSSAMYNLIKEKFPKLCDEVKADNQIADAKYKADIDKAEVAYNNGDWDTVYAMLKKVYDNGCQSESILENLARASRELGDYDAMIDWDSKRVDSFSSAAAYNARARDYYSLGNNDLALADVNWALMKDKNNAKFLDTRGGIYYEMKQYDKAIKDFDAAIKINDKYAHAYYYRGKCYEALGEKDSAKSDYKKAKKHDAEITDDKADFEKQRSRAQERRQQAHYQKVEKYKEDLKKLNDAVSVHNNAANYPTKVVFENDEIIITVTGNIKNNESKEFYQEVIPQEVRTNYETGVYQQQYEKLKAEVEAAEQAEKAEKTDNQIDNQINEQTYDQPANIIARFDGYIIIYEDPMRTMEKERKEETYYHTYDPGEGNYKFKFNRSELPKMWYKITKDDGIEFEWIAVAFDESTNVFTRYEVQVFDPKDMNNHSYIPNLKKDSTYRFLDINTVEVHDLYADDDFAFDGIVNGIYRREDAVWFAHRRANGFVRFIKPTVLTEAMLNILRYLKKI